MMINQKEIWNLLSSPSNNLLQSAEEVLEKAKKMEGLKPEDLVVLINSQNEDIWQEIFSIAGKMKKKIYGNRIVMFAPLYVSDYCVNNCKYCSYSHSNAFPRSRLSMAELRKEVEILEEMGHKRIALEAGEDDKNCSIDYILECIEAIYSMKTKNGEIRRINVNIAATSEENYAKLKAADIGTYILFQETYDKKIYEEMHEKGPKSKYDYHLNAFDRAMAAGVDDVGAGVLFGLSDPYFELIALMKHNAHLEEKYGAGFHTISIPRLCKADGMSLADFPHLVDDETFIKITALIRLAVPYTGMILSTRESREMREKLLKIGISQISAGSSTGVGGYTKTEDKKPKQFEINDERPMNDIVEELLTDGYIPSFCTGCYRAGRTGDRFMELAKSGEIKNVCLPNSLMTLYEYAVDYGSEEFIAKVKNAINFYIDDIENLSVRQKTAENIKKIEEGTRDLFL